MKTEFYTLSFSLVSFLSWNFSFGVSFFVGSFLFFLFIESLSTKKLFHSFLYTYLFFILYNISATWWLFVSSYQIKAILIFFINSFFMSWPILLFLVLKKYYNMKTFIIIPFWILFEYFHFNWIFSWPWLSFGHVLGANTAFIQWYEYTGVLGGTLWILLVGYISYISLKSKQFLFLIPFLFIVPMVLSKFVENSFKVDNDTSLVTSVVGTDLKPYEKNTDRLKQLYQKITSSELQESSFILLPEYFFEDKITKPKKSMEVKVMQSYIKKNLNENTRIMFGTEVEKNDKKYNTVIDLTKDGVVNIYKKEKLVPFHESEIKGGDFMNIGSMSLSRGEDNKYLSSINDITPFIFICYETIFGEFMAMRQNKYDNESVIFIFSNEGFMNYSLGITQYLNIVKTKSIELRKYIARSSNCGYYGFIDYFGNSDLKIANKEGMFVFTKKIYANNYITFYSKNKKIIPLVSIVLLVVTFLFCSVQSK